MFFSFDFFVLNKSFNTGIGNSTNKQDTQFNILIMYGQLFHTYDCEWFSVHSHPGP